MVPETFIEGCRAHLDALASYLQEHREHLLSCGDALDVRQCAGRLLVHFVSCRIQGTAQSVPSLSPLPFAPEDVFPQHMLCDLSDFLATYHYIIDEEAGSDGVVSPESLGLLHEIALGTKNVLGAYYTPDVVVAYMCRESLSDVLTSGMPVAQAQAVRAYVCSHDAACLPPFDGLTEAVRCRLWALTVCDPAVGAGAFALGFMREFCSCLRPLVPDLNIAALRRHFFEHCFYGVDIDGDAVDIARLRCAYAFLSDAQDTSLLDCARFHLFKGDSLLREGEDAVPELQDGAFDIVIGNPPYGIKMSQSAKKHCKSHYAWLGSRYDIYLVFLERGFRLTRNILCYITPDKWLTKSFGLLFREKCMVPYLHRIVRLGNAVFGTALVDSVVSFFDREAPQCLTVERSDDGIQIQSSRIIDRSLLVPPYLIDEYFQAEPAPVIAQLERQTHRFREYAVCEYASANPKSAYLLPPYLQQGPLAGPYLKVLNTGLIGKYRAHWDHKTMRYLRQRYDCPTVALSDLATAYGVGCPLRMQRPKLILKGLSLLDACLDLDGSYFSTVATLLVFAEAPSLLKILAAILNTSMIHAYLRAKYASSSYCGGLLFTPDMIGSLPVPDLTDLSAWRDVMDAVDEALCAPAISKAQCLEIERLVVSHYGL